MPITEATAETLRQHLASEHEGEAYVFETRTSRPLDRHNVGRELRRTLARVQIDDALAFPKGERRPSLHSFRHNAASHLLNAGMTADDVARRLRHKDATVTRAVYVHEIKDAERMAADRAVMGTMFALSYSSQTISLLIRPLQRMIPSAIPILWRWPQSSPRGWPLVFRRWRWCSLGALIAGRDV